MRVRRTLLGYSQERLGEAIGLTFQQVQKYERGANRISAGTLYRLSRVLDVPVSFFFDSYDDPHDAARPERAEAPGAGENVISRREARLLRLWRAAPPAIADEMLALLSALSPQLREGQEGAEAVPRDAVAPLRIVDRSEAGRGVRPRRRHGAVWDPADIYRSNKTDA